MPDGRTGGRGRRWCFTLNNPDDHEQVQGLWQAWRNLRAGVCQLEVGENGTRHYQGYTEWTEPLRLGSLKLLLPRAHWEQAKGSTQQNETYCTKEDGRIDGPWRIGEFGGQPGRRNDLLAAKAALDGGASVNDLADEHFSAWVKYREAFHEYKRIKLPERNWQMDVIVLCGPTGTGKSSLARDLAGKDAYWWFGGSWWDGYDGGVSRTVVMDEFRGGVPFTTLLRLCDRYPYSVEVKGGVRSFTSKCIIITSNQLPEQWYDREKFGQDFGALFRRISHFFWMDGERSYYSKGYQGQGVGSIEYIS